MCSGIIGRSHYIHKELTRIAHGMLEGLAAAGKFGWYGPQLPYWWSPWGSTAESSLRGHPGQVVGRRKAWGSVRGSVAPFTECTRSVAIFGKGSMAVGKGCAAMLGRDPGMSVTVSGVGVAVG